MVRDIENLIDSVYDMPYSKAAFTQVDNALTLLKKYNESNHFLLSKAYEQEMDNIRRLADDLSAFKSNEDRLLQKKIQKQIANLARKILDDNKKIFVVHGRNIGMRDKVSAVLGKLRLDHVILESEFNSGATIIEKFLRNAKECGYAIVLFSADDMGCLADSNLQPVYRARQNVVLELGYFLAQVGRQNILILHDADKAIEKPSDFDGIVYEPFDSYGAWKGKLVKELRMAKIYVDAGLADRI